MSEFSLPVRPRRSKREHNPKPRDRSRSPDSVRAPLRDRDVNLPQAAGANRQEMRLALAMRPKNTTEDNIRQYLNRVKNNRDDGDEDMFDDDAPEEKAPSEVSSDADDITIPSLLQPVQNPLESATRIGEAQELYRNNPTSLRTPADYLIHFANLDGIAAFWGACPSQLLSPSLLPKNPVTAPPKPGHLPGGPLAPAKWDPGLVKALRLLAPRCTASEANFWLLQELRKDRREHDPSLNAITKHHVYAVYKEFKRKGYKAKELAEAQKEKKEVVPRYEPARPPLVSYPYGPVAPLSAAGSPRAIPSPSVPSGYTFLPRDPNRTSRYNPASACMPQRTVRTKEEQERIRDAIRKERPF